MAEEVIWTTEEDIRAEREQLTRWREDDDKFWTYLRRYAANRRRNEQSAARYEHEFRALQTVGWAKLSGPERERYLRLRDQLIPGSQMRQASWALEVDRVVKEIYAIRDRIRTEEERLYRKKVKPIEEQWIADEECLLPETLIFTNHGLKPISSVRKGDLVVTLSGHENYVTKVFRRKIEKQIYCVKPYYFPEIGVTANHPFLVVEKNYQVKSNKYVGMSLSEPKWLPIRVIDLNTKANRRKFYIGFPIDYSQRDIAELNENRCKLLGYYAAEGCKSIGRQVLFTLNPKEIFLAGHIKMLAWKEFNANCQIKVYQNALWVRVYSAEFYRFIDKYCKGTARGCNKHFTSEVLWLPPKKQMIILEAAWEGDGTTKRNGQKRYGSSSKELVIQLQWMLLRNNIIAGLSVEKDSGGFSVGNDFYSLNYTQKPLRYGFIKGNFLFVPIKKMFHYPYKGFVYNLHVKPHECYLTQSGLVHNCSGYDIYYRFADKKYIIRDEKKALVRVETKICLELTASIETHEGHDVPVVVEITCTTYVKEKDLSALIQTEKAVERGLVEWLLAQGWGALMKGFTKEGVAYNGEIHIETKAWYTWTVPDYPKVHVYVEKKEPRYRAYEGDYKVEE